MRITKLETLRVAESPEILRLRVHTDASLVGLGETKDAVVRVTPA